MSLNISHQGINASTAIGFSTKPQALNRAKRTSTASKKLFNLIIIVLTMIMTSCNSWREVVYFQDLDQVVLRNQQTESAIRIKPGDQLTIMVFGADKYLIMPYNQTLASVSENGMGGGGGRENQLPYDVDKDGYIKFPVLGRIKVSGLTTDELRLKLHEILDKDVKDMTVFVAIENFRINVLGEVARPGKFEIKNNSCTFLEALALAGDMTIGANRKRVCLIRTEEGTVKHYYYDLTKTDLLDSKHLYLQQNDVIVVPPTNTRVKIGRTDASQRSAIISACSMMVGVVGLLVSLFK